MEAEYATLMVDYYTGSSPSSGGGSSSSGSSGWGGGAPRFEPISRPSSGRRTPTSNADPNAIAGGKMSIDLTDPLGSIGESLVSAGQFAGGIAGGVLGAAGGIGFGEHRDIGGIVEGVGNAIGAVGGVGLPFAGKEGATAGTIGDIPGRMLDVVTAPGRAVERTIAGQRVEHAKQGLVFIGGGQTAEDAKLPPDLQQRLDAGESVDVIADALVARNAGFTNNPIMNAASGIVLDPTNLIAPGLGKAAQATKNAGIAVQAVDDLSKLGLGERFAGRMYNTAARNMSAGGAAFMDKVIGPSTSGVFHALGTEGYNTLLKGAAKVDSRYGTEFANSFAAGAGQIPLAVVAGEIGDEASAEAIRYGKALTTQMDAATLTARVGAKRAWRPGDLERRAEELLRRVAPDFAGHSPQQLLDESVKGYAAATGMSVEDAARVIGPKVDLKTAQTIDLAASGRAGDALAKVKAGIKFSDNIDIERLTLVSRRTLTTDRAAEIEKGAMTVSEAIDRYPVLANRFLGKSAGDAEVLDFIAKLRKEDALITTVKQATTRKNALPSALGDWRRQYADVGYDIGFAPKDGMKTLTDADGNIIRTEPFVHFSSEFDPVTMRNPLGRFVDNLMRGTTQTTIVLESRQRMVDFAVKNKLPVSPSQMRSIHKAIIDEAAAQSKTPRGLVHQSLMAGEGASRVKESLYSAIFRKFLSPGEYTALTAKYDPTFLVMQGFQGNLRTVGLTQYATGGIKRLVPQSAAIAEELYPNLRFKYNPLFQQQELAESPFFNAMRGIQKRPIDPEVAKVYHEMADLPEFKYLTEAGYFLHIAGERSLANFVNANTKIGRAVGRFANVQARKEGNRISQVLGEHGNDFRDAVNAINPKFWQRLTAEYGTQDARIVADKFLTERMHLASGDLDRATKVFDDLHDTAMGALNGTLEGDVIKPGMEAASQAANVEAAALKGGTAASGGAVKLSEAERIAAETVWQAFRDSFRVASQRAFKTHYFNTQRGWLERTINHPYLGIYPASYMWGKVLPEFARFLIKRPFGINAPMLGYAATARVQQSFIGELNDNPEFAKWMEDHKDAIYLVDMLLPGTPDNLVSNVPAWARHVSEDAAAGKSPTVETLGREAGDTGKYLFGPIRGTETIAKGLFGKKGLLGDVTGDLFAQLDKAAKELDTNPPAP